MISTGAFLFAIGLILYIGVIGSHIFEKHRIPDVLNLIGIGVLLGPVLHIVDPSLLTPWMPHVGAMALGLILFEGGLDLDLSDVVHRFGLSFALATATFVANMAAITLIYKAATGAPWIPALLLGAVLGCVSSAVILPISSRLRVPDRIKTTLNLESVLSDLWGVVMTLILIRVVPVEGFSAGEVVHSAAGSFALALVTSGFLGLLWLWALDRLRSSPFAYMMTLATVFLLYGLMELVHASGPMAALTFGVVLTNADKIMALFGKKYKFVLDEKIRWFNTEATFFARTFFFVYLGLVISLRAMSWEFLRISLAIFCAVLICRFLVVRLLRFVGDEGSYELVYFSMIPRGLTSAVLAAMAWGSGIPGTERFLEYAFVTILLSNFCMTGLIRKAEAASGNGPADPTASGTGYPIGTVPLTPETDLPG